MIRKKQYQKTVLGWSTDDIDKKVNQLRDQHNVTAVQTTVVLIKEAPVFVATVIFDAQ